MIERLRKEPAYLQFMSLVGLGGSGKSRLLEEIKERIEASDIDVVWVTLEEQTFGPSLSPLLTIRHKLEHLQCLLFDYALARYAASRGRLYELMASGAAPNSEVFTAIDLAVKLAGYAIPAIPWSLATKVLGDVEQRLNRKLHYDKADFEEIDNLANAPDEIRERLPFYLGTDLNIWCRVKQRGLVVLYDAYDKQRLSEQRDAEWLTIFIEALGRGVHVIATRDSLRANGVRWPAMLLEYDVMPLEERYCEELIAKVTTGADRSVIARIMKVSQGIPLILTACINDYLTLRERLGAVDANLLSATPSTAIKRFFDHLSEAEREVAIALAAVQFFDTALLRAVAREFRTASASLTTVPKLFFVQELEAGLFKVHDIVTGLVRQDASLREQRVVAVEMMSRLLLERLRLGEQPHVVLSMFIGVLEASAIGDPVPMKATEALIDAGYFFYDHGYWSDLITIGSRAGFKKDETGTLIAQFFRALSLRRTRSIDVALDHLAELQLSRTRFGRHADSIDLEVAYLHEIAGHYHSARRGFADLHARSRPFDPTNRTHVRALLHHADMLVLDGSLNTGSDLILHAAERLVPGARVDWAEYTRLRGHAFRFSLLFEEAEALYSDALRAARDVAALAAKLKTNFAESTCWIEPNDAIDAAWTAIEANQQLGSRIELGKSHAALCIAFAGMGKHADARESYEEAKRFANAVHYPAGILFAEIAGCALAIAIADVAAYSVHYSAAKLLVGRLGTYGHLLLLPAVLGGQEREAQDIANQYGWIDHRDILTRATLIANRFKRS